MVQTLCVALALLGLPGCVLDKEDTLRGALGQWFELGATRHFTSTWRCTVALFDLRDAAIKKGGPEPTDSLDAALARIAADLPVLFAIPDKTPDDISQDVMSRDLARGIGLISSGIGPTRECMQEDWLMRGTYRMLTSPDTRMIYAPSMDALLLMYPPDGVLLYMRGTV